MPRTTPPNHPRPRKALGQHYLVDSGVFRSIIEAAELGPSDTVVEVGPGPGGLTRELVANAGKVVAIEIDSVLAAALPRKLGEPPNLSVVVEDAREVDLASLLGAEGPYKMVSNLPYYAAAPILRRFLEGDHPKPTIMVVMVQKEVASSIIAADGRMSLLAVGIQLYGVPVHVCDVPPWAFRPSPKVTSSVIRIDVLPHLAVEVDDTQKFFDVVRAGFSAPRKQIRNSLSHGLGIGADEAGELLGDAGLNPKLRPENLDLKEWARLYRVVAPVLRQAQ